MNPLYSWWTNPNALRENKIIGYYLGTHKCSICGKWLNDKTEWRHKKKELEK